jgi:Nucleotidyl transferase of unknown function (DUF2204)
MSLSEELEVLKEVGQRLDQAGIPYMITGSTAGNFYTVPRMTRDIDLVVELEPNDVERIVQIFCRDFYLDRETVADAIRSRRMFNVIHSESVIKVDFIVRKDSPYRRTEFARRRKILVEDQEIQVVAPEDLILSKLEWAKESRSEFQLTDVRNLFRSAQGLDLEYLAHWAKELGIEALYREVSP